MTYRITTNEIIERFQKVHGIRYNYNEVIYDGYGNKVLIICNSHGEFTQTPATHIRGSGCPKCGFLLIQEKTRLTTDEFIIKARQIHSNKYDYFQVQYKRTKDKIKILCKSHGSFLQKPNDHLAGNGCPRCSNNSSALENKWLDSLNLKNLERQKRIYIKGNYYKPDGYDPDTNTVYEFWGDFWHGNPDIYDLKEINKKNGKTFGELYEATHNKIKKYKNNGYRVIDIWENDFQGDKH